MTPPGTARSAAWCRPIALLLAASFFVVADRSPTDGAVVPARAARDSLPRVQPGGIATVPVRFPAGGHGTVRYRIRPREDVRLLGDTTGRAPAADGDYVVPVTVLVPEHQAAGPWTVASVVVGSAAADRTRRRVRVRVEERRGLELVTHRSPVRGTPGGRMRVPFTVTNVGNVSDTVRMIATSGARRWRVVAPRTRRPLRPGARWRDTARVRIPGRLEEGVAERVVLRAASRETAAEADVLLRSTTGGTGVLPGMEKLPASVFLGTSGIGPGGPSGTPSVVGSLDASGSVGEGLELDLFARHRPRWDLRGGVRPLLTGPAVRARLSADRWEMSAGDVHGDRSPLAGRPLSGRGVRGRWSRRAWGGGVFLTKPPDRSGMVGDGQRLLGYLDHRTGHGAVGMTATWIRERPYPGGPKLGSRSVGVGYEADALSGLDHLRVRGGWMQLTRADTLAAGGPSAEVEFRLRGERGAMWVQGRRVPGFVPIAGRYGNQLRWGGRLEAASGLELLGNLYHSDVPLVLSDRHPARRGFRAGGAVTVGKADAQLRAGLQQERAPTDGGWRDQLQFDLDFFVPTGPLRWSGRVDVEKPLPWRGRSEDWNVHFLQAGLRYAHGDLQARLSAHAVDAFRDTRRPGTPWRVTLGGRWSGENVGVRWRAQTLGSPARPGEHLDGWARLQYGVSDRSALVTTIGHAPEGVQRAGTVVGERRAGRQGGWTATLGVRLDLDLPLPIPRDEGITGTVFRDLNGNLRRDEGEPGLRSVELQKGWVRTTTDRRGRFEISERSVADRRLRVEPASLPAGLVLPPSLQLPSSGTVAIPVLEPARLQLLLFRDENGNGRNDEAEAPVPRARVELTGRKGRNRRYRQRPDGSGDVTFGALLPGSYRLTVRVPATRFRKAVRWQKTVSLAPGSKRSLEIPVPSGRDSIP